MSPLALCTYEDRAESLSGVILLLSSLRRHQPDAKVTLFCSDTIYDRFSALSQQFENVRIRVPDLPPQLRGYAVKPFLLLSALELDSTATWIDSDIVLAGPIDHVIARLSPTDLLVAQEAKTERVAGAEKARDWGLPLGRSLSFGVNSCFLRVNRSHRPLLESWHELLITPEFQNAQRIGWQDRPRHAFSDQDVLESLLCSGRFASVDVTPLLAGVHIAQCFYADGYSASERIRNVFSGTPPLVHCQGPKPWMSTSSRPLVLDVSTYNYIARQYRDTVPDSEWTSPQTIAGKLLDRAFMGHPSLVGLVPALLMGASRKIRLRTRLRQVRQMFRISPVS